MTEATRRLLILLGVMGLLALILFGWDKLMARTGRSRVPEAALLGCAALGGGVGALLGMLLFRHKIRKLRFTVPVPLFALLQIGLLIWAQWS